MHTSNDRLRPWANLQQGSTMSSIRALGTMAIAAVLSISTFAAQAATIVDTGTHSGPPGLALDSGQWLAGEFSVTGPALISGVEGFMDAFATGTATIAIYSDGGDLPGAQLHFQGFSASPGFAWQGINSGLSWALPTAGQYWVAFEVRPLQTLSATVGDLAPAPLINEAVWNGSYIGNDALNFSVRIFGTVSAVSPVPEPSTYALMIAGLGLVGFVAHRRRKTSRPA